MKVIKKAILPVGFKASAAASGIKRSGKLDLALFYSQVPARAACLFTTSKMPAAPLKLDKKYLKAGNNFQAIIVNSGNANSFTGKSGMRDAEATAKSVAAALKLKKESVLVNSTGIIGKKLPVAKIKKAIPELTRGLSGAGIAKAKKAILTTDNFSKEATVQFKSGEKTVTICGIAKGAGMIAPDMATMLVFIFTDADIRQAALKKTLRACAEFSFNCITVDGCMSTNDSVMALANAAAGNSPISAGKKLRAFKKALGIVCLELAKMVVRDAEGAGKFIRIKVSCAKNSRQAKKAALSIANSPLFKTAMHGENPNFGRIVASVGASGVDACEEGLKIKVSPLNKKDIFVDVCLNRGDSSATVYTSDLTPEYVKINAEYN
jgi:glutamate N-acetyltransferase/amino-acid N-acetyltransferase